MENTNKNFITIIILIAIIVILAVSFIAYIAISSNNKPNNENLSQTNNNNIENNDNTLTPTNNLGSPDNDAIATGETKESSKSNMLNKGDWGIANKYNPTSSKYEEVKVKISNFTRGEDAKNIVKKFVEDNSYFKYEEPNQGMEWVVIDYDMDFYKFIPGELGATTEVPQSIQGLGENRSVTYNGVTYILSTQDIGNRDYVKVTSGSNRFATQLPIGCSDYCIVFGTENQGIQAFFKGE